MKGMKGKFLKKLKFIPTISTLKQSLVLQINLSEKNFSQNCQTTRVDKVEQDHNSKSLPELAAGSIHVSELVKVFQDEEMELEFDSGDRENLTPPIRFKDTEPAEDNLDVQISVEDYEKYPSLLDFEEKCPPGGSNSVILYTTSLRGIRKTFEECNSIRFLLESFHVLFQERDVSMHLEFREELWRIFGFRVIPPRLFIKGRFIGGADEVVGLHEQGKLRKLLEGIPLDHSNCPCTGCAGMRFVVCLNCSGSRKVVTGGEKDELYIRCHECNENGLVRCPICC